MRPLPIAMCLGAYTVALYAFAHAAPNNHSPKRQAGVAAFQAITPVLRHPRCLVCHSTGDYPRQGDDLHRHIMDVRRGPNGDGAAPVHCSTCHQDRNLSGIHVPPGAADWRLPPPDNPMIWEGLTNRQLCELLVDMKRNGGRDAKGIEEHMHTPLVTWGWHPGEDRTPVPMPSSTFLKYVHVWAAAGAPCPES
jgi:hypothetical protein